MKIKNLLKKEINKSYFSQYVQNSIINNEEHPFCLYGNFFIDGLFFLPIEHNTLTTSLDLFSFLHKIKYEKYFTSDYLNLLKNHTKNIQVLRNCFVVGNDDNYYHNLILYLPKMLTLFNNKKLISNIDYILFNKNLPTKFIKLVKEILIIKKINKKIIFIDQKLYLLKDSYCPVVPGRDFKLEKNIFFWQNIYKKILERNKINKINFDKIYISREDSFHRKILNEKELIVLLKKLGFKIILLSKLDIFSQINLFNKAKVIVGYHGAGLANIVFSRNFTRIVELYPKAEQNLRKNFKVISKVKQLEHIFFFIDYKSNQKKSKNITYFDGIVDIDKFNKFINNYLN